MRFILGHLVMLLMQVMLVTGSASHAAEVSEAETILRKAMMKGSTADQRQLESGTAIRALIKLGFVSRKPEPRADYVDYRQVRKPLTLFGHAVRVIEEEYLVQFIGCCVNTGLGLVIEKAGDISELDAFLKASQCRVNTPSGPEYTMEIVGLKPKPGSTYLEISCREHDFTVD